MRSKTEETKTVLIVEDESSLNHAYQIILMRSGYDILSAFDGKEALQISKELEPDVILLDLRMPVLDGIGFMKAYKSHKKNRAKIIVFTNYDMQKDVKEVYELGADKYILKARVSPKELLKVVAGVLEEGAK